MTNYNSDLLRVLEERGYIHQVTDAAGLDALAARQIVPGYIGFDATAPSLHIGSLVQIMMLRRLQQAFHHRLVEQGIAIEQQEVFPHRLARHPAAGQVIGDLIEGVEDDIDQIICIAIMQALRHLFDAIAEYDGDPLETGGEQMIDLMFDDGLVAKANEALGTMFGIRQ